MLSTSTSASQQFHAHAPANARGHAVPGKATGRNPLTDLIQTEKAYLGTLKIIDSVGFIDNGNALSLSGLTDIHL